MPSFRSSDARLAYEDVGAGAPVVLLHGFTSSFAGNWRERGWVEPLTGAGFRVLGLDARGHGASEKRYAPEWYDSPLLAADVVALLDRLGLARAALVGFSMGGGTALRIAIERTERVSCVAVGGVGDEGFGEDARPLLDSLARALAGEPTDDATANGVAASARAAGCDLGALAAFARRGRWPADLPELGPIAVPLLVVTAGCDRFMPSTARLGAAWPDARRVHVPGAQHGELAGHAAFKRAVLDFLQSNASSTDSQTSS